MLQIRLEIFKRVEAGKTSIQTKTEWISTEFDPFTELWNLSNCIDPFWRTTSKKKHNHILSFVGIMETSMFSVQSSIWWQRNEKINRFKNTPLELQRETSTFIMPSGKNEFAKQNAKSLAWTESYTIQMIAYFELHISRTNHRLKWTSHQHGWKY